MSSDDSKLFESFGASRPQVVFPHHLQHRRAHHSGREGEIVERQRQSREDQLLQIEEWIIPHRGVAQGRQPLEEVREKVHDEDAEPERRQRDADARENSAEVVQPGVLFHCGGDAQRNGRTHGQHDRHDRQFHRDEKPVLQLMPDRRLVPQRRAEIAVEHVREPARVLNVDRSVEAEGLPQLPELLRRYRPGVALPAGQDRQRGVSGDDPEEGEHEDRRHQQRRDEEQRPPDRVLAHAFFRSISSAAAGPRGPTRYVRSASRSALTPERGSSEAGSPSCLPTIPS